MQAWHLAAATSGELHPPAVVPHLQGKHRQLATLLEKEGCYKTSMDK